MNRRVIHSISAVVLLSSFAAAPVQAHFLFVRILPPAEGGRAAEVYFSEKADAGDPRYIDKVASTQLWAQTEPGTFRPLAVAKGADRLRAHLPIAGSLSVIGVLDYGVLARPLQTPFLLRHYPKAVAGKPDEVNRLRPRSETRLEIVPRFEDERVLLTVLRDGRPLAGATIHTVDVNLVGDELKTDEHGQVAYTPPSTGVYSLYTPYVDKTPGEKDGKHYEEIREFATLAFTWPLVRTDADAEAVKLFEDALATRAQWKDFHGITARVEADVDGRTFSGPVTVAADGSVELDAEGEPVAEWVRDQLASIAMHRAAASGDASSGSHPVLRFADDDDDHPLGRLLEFDGGQFASSYRVKDNQIAVVNRNFHEQDMTITVLDNERNADGFYLPRSYTVQYWDAETGRLARVESIQDRWQRVGNFDLPKSHTVTTATDAGLSLRTFSLFGHKVGEGK
ncbi:MAG: DUF3386 family protein [Planctomycetia bacterium]|nr:DUF3386 family protein [Planctomycetia bacterium]